MAADGQLTRTVTRQPTVPKRTTNCYPVLIRYNELCSIDMFCSNLFSILVVLYQLAMTILPVPVQERTRQSLCLSVSATCLRATRALWVGPLGDESVFEAVLVRVLVGVSSSVCGGTSFTIRFWTD